MLTLEQRDEVARTVETIRGRLEELVVRGVTSAGPDEAATLGALRDELTRLDAPHLASRLGELADALTQGGRGGGVRRLLLANTTLRVFERVMTLDVVDGLLGAAAASDPDEGEPDEGGPDDDGPDADEAPAAAKKTRRGAPAPAGPALPPAAEQKKLLPVLEELGRVVEDLVATGLTAASPATRAKLQVSATEAARLKLQRLAPALRYVNEEVQRFLDESPSFSATRLTFFLTRSWLLVRGLERALRTGDAAAAGALLWQRGGAPVQLPLVRAVVLGVSKRIVQDVSSAFEYRMRVLEDAGPLRAGQSLAWSFLRQLEPSFSADALLHIEQPQRFRPIALLGDRVLEWEDVAVSVLDAGPARLQLGPPSRVRTGASFDGWEGFVGWDVARALERVRARRPSPLDLEVELEEEVVLDDWTLGEPRAGWKPDTVVYPVTWRGVPLDAIASTHAEGEALRARLDALRKKKRLPPLFGLVHYELGRVVLRPLATLGDGGPRHLMISDENVNLADLTRAIMRRA